MATGKCLPGVQVQKSTQGGQVISQWFMLKVCQQWLILATKNFCLHLNKLACSCSAYQITCSYYSLIKTWADSELWPSWQWGKKKGLVTCKLLICKLLVNTVLYGWIMGILGPLMLGMPALLVSCYSFKFWEEAFLSRTVLTEDRNAWFSKQKAT